LAGSRISTLIARSLDTVYTIHLGSSSSLSRLGHLAEKLWREQPGRTRTVFVTRNAFINYSKRQFFIHAHVPSVVPSHLHFTNRRIFLNHECRGPFIIPSFPLTCTGRLWLSSVSRLCRAKEWPNRVTHTAPHKAARRVHSEHLATRRRFVDFFPVSSGHRDVRFS
jgi:hypothetical protein